MGFFDSVKCATGFHDYTDWLYKVANECSQTRTCKRNGCVKVDSRTFHEWTEFNYVAANSCMQKRICKRCNEQESRLVSHLWSEWGYAQNGNCEQYRKCSRCEIKETKFLHQWDVWQYESPTSCEQIRFCRRCPTGTEKRKPSQEEHQWAAPKRVDCGSSKRICLRCKTADAIRLAENDQQHVFDNWEQLPDGRTHRICVECRYREYKDRNTPW